MIRFFLLLFLFSPFPPPQESMVWLGPTDHDFGEIPSGTPVQHTFRFRNLSNDSLRIDNVRATCGCTSPNWPETGVLPDSIGAITISYDARDQGYFRKKIRVYFHGQRRAERLTVEGWIVD